MEQYCYFISYRKDDNNIYLYNCESHIEKKVNIEQYKCIFQKISIGNNITEYTTDEIEYASYKNKLYEGQWGFYLRNSKKNCPGFMINNNNKYCCILEQIWNETIK